jgi:hypothetical protein
VVAGFGAAAGVRVVSGERRLLLLGDGAAWDQTWFEGVAIGPIRIQMMDRTALVSETPLSKESVVSGKNDPGNGFPLDGPMPILYIMIREALIASCVLRRTFCRAHFRGPGATHRERLGSRMNIS